MPKANGTNWDLLVENVELASEAKNRLKPSIEESVLNADVPNKQLSGWTIKKAGKKKTIMIKEKSIGDSFEDRIWTIFYKMGFKVMNRSNNFHLAYSQNNPELNKQLDVIAIDDETCVFVECKAASKEGTKHDWLKDIQEMESLFPKLCTEIKKQYPNRKCKYIFATENYYLGDMDRQRLDEFKIYHFDDNMVLYYEKLVSYLGSAAKYQLLGAIFAGQEIVNMDNRVPAIKGFMGGKSYYSFLIKPDDLLKIGYVLHRTNANNDYEDLLPSYQRLIKKDRLNSVREFVNKGGYFPNSLIISIDTKKGKPLQFDLAAKDMGGDSISQMGVLHLPKTYQSAYIIDGQHRLYGYSDSNYSRTNSIPVVAFDNLSKEEQLELFVDINENQKAVSKALRNILEIDLYYDSPRPSLRHKALLGMIAKRLGEDPKSPLCGRIIIGEDAQTIKCCITLDYVKAALDKTGFFTKYKNNDKAQSKGLFDMCDNTKTIELVYPFLVKYLGTIKENCQDAWEGYIAKNNTIVAVIRILSDIVSVVLENNPNILNSVTSESINVLYDDCKDYIAAFCSTLNNLPSDKIEYIRSAKGEQAKEQSHYTLQMAFHIDYPKFTNSLIEKIYNERYINYSEKALNEIACLKIALRNETKTFVENSNDWKVEFLSQDHCIDFSQRITRKKLANQFQGIKDEIDEFDELLLSDFYKIIGYSTHWSDFYRPFLEKKGIKMSKMDFLLSLKSINDVFEKAKNGKSVTLSEFNQVHETCQYFKE